jgi:hypothetical protein
MRDALKRLAIPNSSELRDQLISPEYDYNLRGELHLEKKSDMKRRGVASPDIADALALKFLDRCILAPMTIGLALATS